MRTPKLFVVISVLLMLPTLASARASKSLMVGSKHDLTGFEGSPPFTLCNFCHVAHQTAANTVPPNLGPLLWNHTLSTKTSYGVYSSQSFDALGTDITDLGPLNKGFYTDSNMCLSCHDGTVAVDSWYAPVSCGPQPCPQNVVGPVPPSATIKNLANTHPVNFTYYSAGWFPKVSILHPASANSVDGAGEIPLFNGKMQCSTCHDPHNKQSPFFEQQFPTQSSGTFCTYCHL